MSGASRRVGVLTLSDASETTENNPISSAGENLDDKVPCIPKLLTGLCIGQMVMLVASAAAFGAIGNDYVSIIDLRYLWYTFETLGFGKHLQNAH